MRCLVMGTIWLIVYLMSGLVVDGLVDARLV